MRRACALLIALGSLYTASALDPRKALTQYSRAAWTQQHGLPQDGVRAITQTTDGYLWLGTDEGLARFDGYEFVVFSRDRGDLPSNSITALAAGKDGSLWIGSPGGLARYRDGRFRTYTHKDGLPDDSVSGLFVDHAGIVWIVAGGNLSRFDGTSFINFLRERDFPMRSARAVTEDDAHTLYLAGNSSVARLESGKFIDLFGPAALQADFPAEVRADHKGNLWIRGVRGLIERSPGGAIRRYGAREGLSDSYGLNAVLEDRDGNLWVGTDGGVARLEDGRFRTRTGAEGSERGTVLSLFEDREGNLWAGGSSGLTRFRDDVFSVYGKSEGLPSDEPNTVYQDRKGRVWTGFLDGGLFLFSSGAPHASLQQRTSTGRVYSIRETRAGQLLVAGRDGLIRVNDRRTRTFVPPDPQGRKRVYDALEDSRGRIWLALPNGLGQLRGDQFQTVIPVGPVMLENSFVTLAEGSDGSLWAGTIRKGLWHVGENEMRLYTTADGLSSDQIRSLYQDQEGVLWIGTFGGGLNALKNGKFMSFTARDGLLSDNVSKVADDGESLWLSTTRGICRVPRKQLQDFSEHRIAALRPVNYGIEDGLRSAQCAPDIGAGADRHADGSLWFVTARGIAVYDPHVSSHAELPPLVHLLEVAWEGRPLDGANTTQVPPGSGRLQIRYAGIHLGAPDRVQYSYKLDGLDSDWVRADNRRAVNYNSLEHGRYRFTVRAELPGGPSSEASYEFDLLPHFYETGWFRLLGVLALAGAVWAAYKLRERQVRSRYAAVLEERARLAREVHDTLAQGFVGISSQLDAVEMSLPREESPARSSLDLARRMARHSLTEARRSVMDLRASALDDQDLAAALGSGAREWTAGSEVEVEVDVHGEAAHVPEEVSHHMYRIAQEAVANVLKHARASRIVLKLEVEPKKLTLRVADNGCGFDHAGAFSSTHGHFGLMGMRERADRLGGEFRLENRAGGGTQLEVTAPLP